MKTLILVVLTVDITPVLAQKLELRFDSGVAKACDKAEIDLHGPVLAAIVKSQRVTNWTWCDRTLDLKKTPINAPKEH